MRNLFLIIIFICSKNIFATNGELFFDVSNISGSWTFKFETIPGEVYYDENFSLVIPPDLSFSRNGHSGVQADAIWGDNNNGTIDDNENEFLVYYGKFKVSVTYGAVYSYFFVEYKDCEYDGHTPTYEDGDVYFRFSGGENKFIRCGYAYTGNFGDYTNSTFNIWELKYYPQINVTSCFDIEITVRNLVNNQDYGVLYVDGQQVNSGSQITVTPGRLYNFSTYNDLVQTNNKFREWSTSVFSSFTNPENIFIENYDPVIAYFYPAQLLTVNNNLEGGTSNDNFEITWQNPSPPVGTSWQYGSAYNTFNYQLPTNDLYTIKALPITSLRYGKSWQFFNWNTGSYEDTIKNIKMTSAKSFIANYKGNLTSNQTDAYSSNSQQKTVRDNNGYYHTVYISMGMPWYTKSVTTNFGGNWSQDIPLIIYNGTAKNAAIDFYGNNLLVVFEYNQTEETIGTFLQLVMIDMTLGSITNYEYGKISIPSNSFGGAKPVIAYTNGEVYVAYKESASSTLKFWRNYQDGLGQWQTASGNITNTTSNSINVTLASRDFPNDIHLAWQERTTTGTANSIKYMYSNLSGTARNYSSFTTISGGSGFIHNINPSISYYSSGGSRYPIVSWTGRDDESQTSCTVIRPKSSIVWGSVFITGTSVNNTVNQSVTNSDNTVIAWSENNGSSSKYAKRINAQYSCVGKVLSDSSTDVSLSGGNSLSQIKALIFKGTGTAPYLINKSTKDFSSTCIIEQGALSKITANDTIVTFGRSGIVSINDIEFIFEIGDILVGDSIIKFIEIPDTLAYNSANELNQHTRTNNFTLTPETNFYFSNIYHVVQKSNPDTAITTLDAVNFKAELINALTDQVVGTFDNITYNKNNLEKYANIDYEVDCSGIIAGEYYLRLVTNVNGNANYTLANIYNDNTTLAKKNFNKVNFMGSEIPTTYDLAQNYPNPFNPSTTIRYQLPQDGIVTLKIYDILGSEVATLVNEEKVAGKYEVNFNASSLASGVYIYKIQAGSFVSSKKMVLLK